MMVAVAKIIIIIIVTINITTTTTITFMIIMISSRHDRMICKMLVSDKWWWRREKTGTNIRWGLDKTLNILIINFFISWSSTFKILIINFFISWSSTFYILIINIVTHCINQAGTSCVEFSKADLVQNIILKVRILRFCDKNCRRPSFLREKWHSCN